MFDCRSLRGNTLQCILLARGKAAPSALNKSQTWNVTKTSVIANLSPVGPKSYGSPSDSIRQFCVLQILT